MPWVEVRDAAQYPATEKREPRTTKNHPASNINSAMTGKIALTLMYIYNHHRYSSCLVVMAVLLVVIFMLQMWKPKTVT